MYKKTHESSKNKSSKKQDNGSSNISNIIAFNENGSVAQAARIDAERIDHLKIAINKGNYTINPLRVAEKFIQFETQLSV